MKKIIKRELNKIEIPKELNKRSRIGIEKASVEMKGENKMNKNIKQIISIAAAFLLSISLVAISNPTLANSIKGFFRDITNSNGSIVGTEYNQATEEIEIRISDMIVDEDMVILPIEVTLKDISKAPFSEIDILTMDKFNIIHSSGDEIDYKKIKVESISKENYNYEIEDENNLLTEIDSKYLDKRIFTANLIIDKNELTSNEGYILRIESFYGHKKADSPIKINGYWEINLNMK